MNRSTLTHIHIMSLCHPLLLCFVAAGPQPTKYPLHLNRTYSSHHTGTARSANFLYNLCITPPQPTLELSNESTVGSKVKASSLSRLSTPSCQILYGSQDIPFSNWSLGSLEPICTEHHNLQPAPHLRAKEIYWYPDHPNL